MKKLLVIAVLAVAGLAITSCPNGNGASTAGGFISGPLAQCIPGGVAKAGMITDASETVVGLDANVNALNHEKSALGNIGDFKLMNNKAAFIVQRADWRDSYFPFGGNLLDAVAIENCQQAGPEQFQELQLLVGKLDPINLENSMLRAVSADNVFVLNDGSDGNAAIVRVTGTEQLFHTVEHNLMAALSSAGITYVSPPPLNLDITIDYILEPDSSVLRIELTAKNTQATQLDILDGLAVFWGDTTPAYFPHLMSVSIESFSLAVGVPWIVATRGDGAWALAMPDAMMSAVTISGLTAALDFNLIPPPVGTGDLIHLAPAGEAGDSHTFVNYFSVGPTDQDSALQGLYDLMPEPLPGVLMTEQPISGFVYDLATGDPLEGAAITVELFNGTDWVFATGFVSDENGEFSGSVPDIGATYQLKASYPGRNSPAVIPLAFPVAASIEIPFLPGGNFYFEVRDDDGELLPSKIMLWQDGDIKYRIHTPSGIGVEAVAPGTYEVSITRGYEYTTYQDSIAVPANGDYYLNATLEHIVNTDGLLSTDGHIHAGPSPDNWISVEERIRTCAAEGLEVPIATDHDFVDSWQWAVDYWDLNAWIVNVAGSEVTAPLPGHTNAYPLVPRYDIDARGGWVQWQGLDYEETYAAERARGAAITSTNHPRSSSGFYRSAQWDPATGTTQLTDPVLIGLQPGDAIWSWNFDTFEYMNGNEDPFLDISDPLGSGRFEDWMSFVNLGYPKVAIGVSDAHDYTPPGYARSYYESPTDSTLEFDVEDLISAIKEGRTFVSTGAIARVSINGVAGMGDTITDQDGMVDLWVHIEALPEIDVTYFKVFVNCDHQLFGADSFVATTDPDGVVKYDGVVQVPVAADSQIVVLGFGDNLLPRGLPQFAPQRIPRFSTNAIFVDTDGNGVFDPPGAKACSYTIP